MQLIAELYSNYGPETEFRCSQNGPALPGPKIYEIKITKVFRQIGEQMVQRSYRG